jgi:hypothetical protein
MSNCGISSTNLRNAQSVAFPSKEGYGAISESAALYASSTVRMTGSFFRTRGEFSVGSTGDAPHAQQVRYGFSSCEPMLRRLLSPQAGQMTGNGMR